MSGPFDPLSAAGPGAAPPGPPTFPPVSPQPAPEGSTPTGGTHSAPGRSDQDDDGGRTSLGDLIGSITQDLSTLVRQEVELAKAELTQSAKRAGTGSGMLAGAGIAGHMVLVFLSVALWWGLGNAIGRGWSALVVALVWAVIAAVLALRGRTELRRVRGIPQTTETVKKIPQALRGEEESHHER